MRSVLVFAGLVCAATAQTGAGFRIGLPPSVASEQVYLAYCLYGSGTYCSWVAPKPHLGEFSINSTFRGRRASYLKAILYAPGCAVEKFTIEVEAPAHRFLCRPLPTLDLTGQMVVEGPAYSRQVDLYASYTATWAQNFFSPADVVTTIPLGQAASFTEDHRFRFVLPDFASDPVTASGSLYIWAKEKGTGKLAALLVPDGKQNKINSLKVQSEYPPEIVFHPCPVSQAPLHDKTGFAIRGEQDWPCIK